MSRLFISHATEDRPVVESKLLGLLKALQLHVWFAEDDIQSAEHWERSILVGLQSSTWFVVVMSPRSATSEWVKDEISWAIENRPQNIIPILIEDCEPRDFHVRLPRIQYIDFREDVEKARERLISLLVRSEYKTDSLANIVNGLMACPSKEILTVIRTEKDGANLKASFIGANARADEFYGRKSGMTIVDTELASISESLSNWMNSTDFDAFNADQQKVYDQLLRGEELYATVPMRINQTHPIPAIRGRDFFPITVAYSKPEEIAGKLVEHHVVMYLDLESVRDALRNKLHSE